MGYTPLGIFVLLLTVGAMAAAVILVRKQKSENQEWTWLLGGFLGLLLGAAGTAASIQFRDHELVPARQVKVQEPPADGDGAPKAQP